jgi:beta-lactamase class C
MARENLVHLTNISKTASTLLLCLSLCLYGCTSPKNVKDTNAMKSFVDSLAAPLMSQNNIPGLSIAVTIEGKHYFFNYGVLSKETNAPVTDESLFELGSVSKTFTSTLACLSELNGNLNLSDPVSKYLPSLRGTAFDSIKLYHLGTHTAGGFPLQLPESITDTIQLMEYYKNLVPAYTRGTYRVYSNVSIGLLGIIAGKTMHESFEHAMVNNVFSKLGMNNTYYRVPVEKMNKYAQGYNKTDSPVRLNLAMLAYEAYGIKSCAKDMITFVDANMGTGNEKGNLQSALINTHTGYFKTTEMVQDLIWEQYKYPVTLDQLLAGNSDGMIYDPNPVTALMPFQSPQADVLINKTGSTGGFSSYVAYIPSKKIGVVMLANKNSPIKPRVTTVYKILSYLESETRNKQ